MYLWTDELMLILWAGPAFCWSCVLCVTARAGPCAGSAHVGVL